MDRTCTVPAEKAQSIFFPIANVECSVKEGDGQNEEELRACANGIMDSVQSDAEEGNSTMYARIDKVNVLGENFLETNRADTPYFKWTIPKNNVFNDLLGRNLTPGSSYAVADGYWVNLSNLEKGSHVIEFGGNFFGGAFI